MRGTNHSHTHKGLCRFDRDTHQITLKLGTPSLANGGPLTKRSPKMPVDYKDREAPHLVNKEFSSHLRHDPIFFETS